MKPKQNKALLAFSLLLISLLAAVVYSGPVGKMTRNSSPQKKGKVYDPATVTEAPLVRSRVKDLVITEVRLEDQGTPQASILIDVTNNRDSAVMSIDFISGSPSDSTGLGVDGLLLEEEVQVVLPPHSLKTFRWNLGSIRVGEPLFLSAAIFADGKEEGDKITLRGIKLTRANFQKRQREDKARKGGQP